MKCFLFQVAPQRLVCPLHSEVNSQQQPHQPATIMYLMSLRMTVEINILVPCLMVLLWSRCWLDLEHPVMHNNTMGYTQIEYHIFSLNNGQGVYYLYYVQSSGTRC